MSPTTPTLRSPEIAALVSRLHTFADQPRPTADEYARGKQWGMANTHLLLWAIFENQYEKAEAGEALSGRRRDDWVQFSLYGVQQLDEHHAVEESTIFPLLEEKGVKMGHNIEQHAAFAPAMMDLINYLTSCLSVDKVEYTAVKHKELINVLIGPVMHHLDEEIATLDPARIATSYSHEESVAMELKVHKVMRASTDAFVSLPMIFAHRQNPDFPPFPFVMEKIIVPYVFYWKHRALWGFGPKAI